MYAAGDRCMTVVCRRYVVATGGPTKLCPHPGAHVSHAHAPIGTISFFFYAVRAILILQFFFSFFLPDYLFFFPIKTGKTGNIFKLWKLNRGKNIWNAYVPFQCLIFFFSFENREMKQKLREKRNYFRIKSLWFTARPLLRRRLHY